MIKPKPARLLSALASAIIFLALFQAVSLAAAAEATDAVAVVIGNRAYQNSHVPAVEYARRDADAFKRYLIDILGYRDGNIIDLRDASQARLESVLGNERTVQGKLWQLVKPGKSDVTVFFSGHGVSGQSDRRGYLLPVDADPERPEISGFPIELLMSNLSKLGAKTAILYVDACFSGDSPKGTLTRAASAITLVPKEPVVPAGLVVLTAGRADQVASWDEKKRHGLFTENLLDGLYGKADRSPHGNGDGKVSAAEIKTYLDDVMTYAARREFGRTQNASLYGREDVILASLPGGKSRERPNIKDAEQATPSPAPPVPTVAPAPGDKETVFWQSIQGSNNPDDFGEYLRKFPKGQFAGLANNRLKSLQKAPPTSLIVPALRDEDEDEIFKVGKAAYARGDYEQALSSWQHLANQGDAKSQNILGLMYHKGKGVSQDNKEAVKWFRMAAEQGYAISQGYLAQILFSGNGVSQNYGEAVKWYRAAAEQGDTESQLFLGYIYLKGVGAQQSDHEAAKWFQRAADRGDATAQAILSGLYLNGKGVVRDRVLAYMWLNLAHAQGEPSALQTLHKVAEILQPSQLAEAERLAREWKPKQK
ncbi:putative Beta-lactamase [Rhodospirillaceae bacterium LM-1]|nr:putative Beta-lactamase [Rhodospirillaceae bacterium LM-1]